MKTRWTFCTVTLLALLVLASSRAQAQVGGSGTKNFIPRWIGTNKLGNSSIKQDATGNIGIGITPWSGTKLYVSTIGTS
jgi:hypothetical protein